MDVRQKVFKTVPPAATSNLQAATYTWKKHHSHSPRISRAEGVPGTVWGSWRTHKCTKQSPSSRGNLHSRSYRQGCVVGSVLETVIQKVFCWADVWAKTWMGWEGARRHLEVKSKSKTMCVYRQIFVPKKTKRVNTHQKFKRLYWYVFPASVFLSFNRMGVYLETRWSTP